MSSVPNIDLRRKIVEMVYTGKDGHIPSSFSILEILAVLYRDIMKYDPANPDWEDRDIFILSKGHGCLAQYVNLHKHGFITDKDVEMFCRPGGILGEHPDRNKVPGAEASTGSLGHGVCYATGIALGYQIRKRPNRLFVVIGDGESHEGTVWEAAHVAANKKLGNLVVFTDWNQSGMQLLPEDDIPAKWRAFGWNTVVVDGHDEDAIRDAVAAIDFQLEGAPTAIVCKTTKGKGVDMLEGHGRWHHRIPNSEEYAQIMEALS